MSSGENTMKNRNNILVSGHRGDRVHNDENTMTAFRRAIDAGVDMIETDVRMTKDGQLVLMHDETVDRTTDGTGRVCDLTMAQVMALNAAAHAGQGRVSEPPATLSGLLKLANAYPDLLLNIEFKDYPTPDNEAFAYACADKICDLLLEFGVESRTYINSFSGRILEHVYLRHGKKFRYHGFYPWFILGEMELDPESFIDVACMQHRYQTATGEVVKYDEPMCPKEWFDHLLRIGIMPLMAPSLKEYAKYDTAFSWGSRIVNPDDPEAMLAHLRKTGRHE